MEINGKKYIFAQIMFMNKKMAKITNEKGAICGFCHGRNKKLFMKNFTNKTDIFKTFKVFFSKNLRRLKFEIIV